MSRSRTHGSVFRRFGGLLRRRDRGPKPITAMTLSDALRDAELKMHYQPMVSAADRAVWGIEALVRWEQGPGETTEARRFLTRATETGLIRRIDESLLGSACAFGGELQRRGLHGLRLSVNVPVDDLVPGRGLVGRVRNALILGQLMPQWLELEVPEADVAGREGELAETFAALTGTLGVSFTLDDYWGVGGERGALSLPGVRAVKVDVRANTDGTARDQLARAVELAQAQGLAVTAKRVETVYEAELAEELGCDYLQGYAFGRPMARSELLRFLEEPVEQRRPAFAARHGRLQRRPIVPVS